MKEVKRAFAYAIAGTAIWYGLWFWALQAPAPIRGIIMVMGAFAIAFATAFLLGSWKGLLNGR